MKIQVANIRLRAIILTTVLLLCSPFSMAGTALGKVTQVLVHTGGGNGQGVVMFLIDGQRNNPPACGAGSKAWALSLEKESGRAIYSLLLAAQAQGKNVTVEGSGNCNSWGDREEPVFINMIN